MKKSNYFLWVTALLLLSQVKSIGQGTYFDWSNQQADQVLLLFKDGVSTDLLTWKDLEFKRSHVRPKAIITDKNRQLDNTIDPRRSIFFNCPIGANPTYTGLPSGIFDEDVFSMWQYVKIFGNWSNSWFVAPAAYADAAHKHGTAVLSSWFFNWDHQYVPGKTKEEDFHSYMIELMTKKDANGNFIYAEPLINALMYFGLDGINYNYEANTNAATTDLQQFHARLYEIAKQKGFNTFHIGWYDMVTNAGRLGRTASLTSNNNLWYYDFVNQKVASDAFMLDYGWGKGELDKTKETADLIGAPNGALDVYAGCWIVGLRQAWSSLYDQKNVSIGLWGEHSMNRIFQHRSGLDESKLQENYQNRLVWFFTGGSGTPAPSKRLPITTTIDDIANDNKLKTFHGLSRYVTERSTVKGNLPFASNFILGNGTFYNENGVKTHGTWYNLSAQDICPTYRWLIVDDAGATVNNIAANFTFNDAWMGGSCLSLTGSVQTAPANVHLYRTELNGGTTVKARIVYKIENATVGENSNLSLIYKKNDETTWTKVAAGNVINIGWNEITVDLTGITSTDIIREIGFCVQGSAKPSYKALIGELKIFDAAVTQAVNAPFDLSLEYMNECATKMDVKVVWSMSNDNKNRLVYNDEVNVAYFEIFKKEGSKIKQIARTSSWAHYLAKVELTPGLNELEIGVRAVSTDLQTVSGIVWKTIPRDPSATACNEDIYCAAKNDMTLNAADAAVAERYYESASTEGAITNLNMTNGQPTTEGYIAYLDENMTISVKPGDTFTFKAQANSKSPSLKWCKYFVYADWNCDRIFDVDTEIIGRGGKDDAGDESVLSLNLTITVPLNATPGNTRIRARYADAWRAHPGACGLATHGYTVDFPVKILGSTSLNQVQTEAPHFYPNPVVKNVTFENVDKVSIYSTTGTLLGVYTEKTADLSHLTTGIYVIKMERDGVIKTTQLVKQ
jgi:endo-beta-N-acetylglucosaminidase D